MKKIVVMGSLVLDITLQLRSEEIRPVEDIFVQGKVTELKNASFYMGGCVGNTGLALHKLGADVTLCGKVGRDFAGGAIRLLMEREGAPCRLAEAAEAPTTVSVAVTPPGLDKISLFLRGASQEYSSEDVRDLDGCDLFHFGYPVTMKRLYADGGAELCRMMKAVKASGATASLDTALPRPDGEHGAVDWRPILEKTLPWVDVFVPSYEECLFMLDREDYLRRFNAAAGRDLIETVTDESVSAIAGTFLSMGAAIVLLKLGSRGLYLRTAGAERLARAGRALRDLEPSWADRELWIFPNAVEKIVSTTGAGDTAIAGFLAAALRGERPERALEIAAATAWLCIQSGDTTGKITGYRQVEEASRDALRTETLTLPPERWSAAGSPGLYRASRDGRG